jgi:hypothetical protein
VHITTGTAISIESFSRTLIRNVGPGMFAVETCAAVDRLLSGIVAMTIYWGFEKAI